LGELRDSGLDFLRKSIGCLGWFMRGKGFDTEQQQRAEKGDEK